MTPEVKIGAVLLQRCRADAALNTRAESLQALITDAARKLGDAHWPSHDFANYHIEICEGNSVNTPWRAVKTGQQGAGSGRTMLPAPQGEPRVLVGLDVFASGPGFDLVQFNNAPPLDVAVLLLAHEIFHLTELDRMSQSRIPYGQQLIAFSQGVHPELEGTWMTGAFTIAELVPVKRTQTPGLALRTFAPNTWKAADIATEACADLMALQHARQVGCNFAMLSASLIQLRQNEEAAAQAIPLDANGHIPTLPSYQIGAMLAAHVGLAAQDDSWPIRKQCWDSAFATLLADPQVDPKAKDVIRAVKIPLSQAAPRPKLLSLKWVGGLLSKKP